MTHTQPRSAARQAGKIHVLGTAQHEDWMAVLRRTVQHDFYHLPQYHAVAEHLGEGAAHLFVWSEGEHFIALPLLLRPVGQEAGEGWNDATSVYGYGGPVCSHERLPELVIQDFQAALREELVGRRVISAFSRLHPLIAQYGSLAGLGECRANGQTVSIDLTQSPKIQRAQFRSTFKTRINKLRRNGAVCLRDADKHHIGDFVSIYHETMRRADAHSSYFFDAGYFERLGNGLGQKLQLFVVTIGGRVAAGAVITHCGGIVQYHLGATGDDFLTLSPMPLLFDTVRLWAQEQGARAFHLGGGVGAREDSLFHFKAGFSDRRHNFATWRWVVVPEVYAKLCQERLRRDSAIGLDPISADYFPAYRCPVSPQKEVAASAHHP